MRCFHKINAVHVGDETEGETAKAVMLECLVSHNRSKIRTADADVYDVLDAFAGMPFPRATANAF